MSKSSYWAKGSKFPRFDQLDRNPTADVVVVGGGILGGRGWGDEKLLLHDRSFHPNSIANCSARVSDPAGVPDRRSADSHGQHWRRVSPPVEAIAQAASFPKPIPNDGDLRSGTRSASGDDAIPAMRMAYSRENDIVVRAMIVEAIWQHRQQSVISFLADALRDPAPMVWKQALDGLVALASPEVMTVLRSAANREIEAERRAWIEEAIEQTTEAIGRR